jgi:hypothetical protein
MIDDNVVETRELDVDFIGITRRHSWTEPGLCEFWKPMRHIERLVDLDSGPLEGGGIELEREGEFSDFGNEWLPYPDGPAGSEVCRGNLEKFVGDSSTWGIVGMHRNARREWKLIKRPFMETHSVYSFFLLNVKATVARKVLYSAKPMWEDIDFNFDLMHSSRSSESHDRLHIVKVNRWFHSKVIPLALPRWGVAYSGAEILYAYVVRSAGSKLFSCVRAIAPLPRWTLAELVAEVHGMLDRRNLTLVLTGEQTAVQQKQDG